MRTIWNWLKRLSWKKRILLALTILMLSSGVFLYAWVFIGLPPIENIQAGLALPSTRIYDRNGKLLYEILPPEQGSNTVVSLDDIPQHCVHAVIATEDANFYTHPGVDVVGVARAMWINIRGGEILAGGSTITQQTARLLLLDPQTRLERTVRRKLRESVLAIRLQNEYSKDEVLELYLNQNYFGNLAYGIEAAARTYFGKSAPELSLAECALLAGLMQNPSAHDPFTNMQNAKDRQEVVLGLMVKEGYITEAESLAAHGDRLQFASARFPIAAPHFVMAVWKQLERDYPEYVYGGGLDVITTVDLDWQNVAQEIVGVQLEYLNHPPLESRTPANANNAAVVAIDPFTGQILTMLGSPDYFDEAIDGAVNAALALRQPGSTLKPFTYSAAMNPANVEPYTAATMIPDIKTPFVTRRLESYTPANYGLVEHGPVLLREALASSYNIPAVVALDHIGVNAMIRLADNAGLETLSNNADLDLSVTLGGGEVRLLDLAQAYSIFPNGGFHIDPSFILKVSTRDGDTLYEWRQHELNNRVLDERIAYIITDILSDEEARIPSFGRNSALSIGRPAAAKTGTTTDFRDNWVMGYTPNLVVGVWVGNADNTPMTDVTGISGAGPIWNQFMRRVLTGQPELEFRRPDGILETEVCALSGLLPTEACALRRRELFLPGTVPTEEDNLYQTFEIDRVTGLLADDNTPEDQKVEQTYIVLPQEARDWGIRNGVRQPPLGAIVELGDDADVRVLQPDPYSIFQISPVTPLETQRIRFTVRTPTGTESVFYTLDGTSLGALDDAPWSMWWGLELGDHELTATAISADGTRETSETVYFRVTDYEPPQSYTVEDNP
jgi:1A family penicillin-binding protein